MIAHVVYRDRNNTIVLQLQADGAVPVSVTRVQICVVGTGIEVDTTSPFIVYDALTGVLTMRLGQIAAITALPNSESYVVEITAYPAGGMQGTAFGSFGIALRDWC